MVDGTYVYYRSGFLLRAELTQYDEDCEHGTSIDPIKFKPIEIEEEEYDKITKEIPIPNIPKPPNIPVFDPYYELAVYI